MSELPSARVVAFVNEKGGVGKTAMSVNFACALGEAGHATLVVDLDAQANATALLGGYGLETTTIGDVLPQQAAAGEAIIGGLAPGVDLLAGSPDLSNVELALAGQMFRERYLAQALEPVMDDYDFIIIDAPPTRGLLTINALVAADEAVVPVNMLDREAYEGVQKIGRTIAQLNQASYVVGFRGILRNLVDHRRKVYKQLNEGLEASTLPLFATEIPLATEIQNAGAERTPLLLRNPDHIGSHKIREAAGELAGKEALAHGIA